MTEAAIASESDLQEVALEMGDDALVLSHRLAEWVTHAPEIEEDIALANVALDLLGQARSLLALSGEIEGRGRDEDRLAFWRDDRDYRNLLLVEQPNGDFACTMVRQLLFSAYQLPLYQDLMAANDDRLAGVAAKGALEARYHLDHAAMWVVRLGDGTEESHRRTVAALEGLWPFTGELFHPSSAWERLTATGPGFDLAAVEHAWWASVRGTLDAGSLSTPEQLGTRSGGRNGLHSEHLGHLLAEMQHLHRSHPDAVW